MPSTTHTDFEGEAEELGEALGDQVLGYLLFNDQDGGHDEGLLVYEGTQVYDPDPPLDRDDPTSIISTVMQAVPGLDHWDLGSILFFSPSDPVLNEYSEQFGGNPLDVLAEGYSDFKHVPVSSLDEAYLARGTEFVFRIHCPDELGTVDWEARRVGGGFKVKFSSEVRLDVRDREGILRLNLS